MELKHLALLAACGLYIDYVYNIQTSNLQLPSKFIPIFALGFCKSFLSFLWQMRQKFQSTLSKESTNSFRVNRLTLLDIAANSRSKYGQIAIFKKCAIIKMNHKVLHLQNAILWEQSRYHGNISSKLEIYQNHTKSAKILKN